MKVTYDVFTTNVQNAKITGLGTDSTKRLMQHCDRQFPNITGDYVATDPLFDDKARDVLKKYVLKGIDIDDEVKYLDSMRYGCLYSPSMVFQQIQRFQSPHKPSFRWNRNYQKAVKRVEELTIPFSKLNILEYRSDEDIKDALPKQDASSGFEYIVTGLKHKGDFIEGAKDQFDTEITVAKENGTFGKPIVTLHRLQLSGAYTMDGERTGTHKKKSRLVSAVDLWQVVAELMWAKPFQRHMATRLYYAGGKKPYELRTLIQNKRQRYQYWYSLDYSTYDQTLPRWLIRDAFEIIWKCFEGCDKYRWLWDIIVDDFLNKSFIGPEGKLYYAEDGVPSGSMFTQIIDTICNLIMICTYLFSLQGKTNDEKIAFDCTICGDDNLININRSLDLEDVAGYLARNFGIECKWEKCSFGTKDDDPEFLSRVWRITGEWRQPKELLAKLLYPERFRPYATNKQMTPEMIIYSYILAFPQGMKELIDVDRFREDNANSLSSWSDAVFGYQSGYWSYATRYENLLS